MRKILFFKIAGTAVVWLLFFGTAVFAQRTVSGTVRDATGVVSGVNIVVKGSSTGALSGVDGKYTVSVPDNKAVLEFSALGYAPQSVAVGVRTVIDVVLKEDVEELGEVLVVAMGQKISEKRASYSAQNVPTEVITSNKAAFTASSLTGKIAGVMVGTSNEIKDGYSLTIRGEGALTVIDGVPGGSMDNIGPEDIESITILKGATAAALYGQAGGSGAIMINTKRASAEGLHVQVSSSNTFEAGWLAEPVPQKRYSTGIGGVYDPRATEVWGDIMDGHEVMQYNPKTYQMELQPLLPRGANNLRNFMVTPWITNDNINITNKGKLGSFRNSLSYIHRQVNWPNAYSDRLIYTVAGDIKFGKFTLDGSATFNKYYTPQEFGIGGWNMAYFQTINAKLGVEYDIRDYKNYWVEGKEQIQQNWFHNYYNNPYWIAHEMTSDYDEKSYDARLNLGYEITPWLHTSVKTGMTASSNSKEMKIPWGERLHDPNGFYEISYGRKWSYNMQALLEADKKFGDFSVNGLLGAASNYSEAKSVFAATDGGLSVPGYFSLRASVLPARIGFSSMAYYYETMGGRFDNYKSANSGIFGKLSLAWRDAVFIDFTGRNDWASTLDASERSYFYPSIGGVVVLTELLPKMSWLNFWKIRGSWTQTKSAPGVYSINQNYSFGTGWNNNMSASYPSSIRDMTLHPQTAETMDLGTTLWFFKSRLKIDVAYYEKLWYDLQVYAPISTTSGFSSSLINSGEQRLRSGIELTLTGDIVATRDFTYTSSVNLDVYAYIYKKLDPVYSSKSPWIKEGGFVNQEIWQRRETVDLNDGNGVQPVLVNGLPLYIGYNASFGKSDSDINWGWHNTFRYKNLTLGFSFDGGIGGNVMNHTQEYMWSAGSHPDSDNEYRYDEVVNSKNGTYNGYVAKGVKVVSGKVEYDQYGNITNDTRNFAINNIPVSYQSYARAYYAQYHENVRDKTFFKFREFNIGYVLPTTLAKKLRTSRVEVSIIGRNLYLRSKEIWGADPENGGFSPPTPRQLGFQIKVDF
jgi:TonB-linked SusC/RagA family outer membrane protein